MPKNKTGSKIEQTNRIASQTVQIKLKDLFGITDATNIKSENLYIVDLNCLQFPCKDDCCRHGVDVLPQEHARLISENLAAPHDFTGPQPDNEGKLLYRTRLGPRGCVFLLPERGCRLHYTIHKPTICRRFPRTVDEALIAHESGDLPCFGHRKEMKDEM